MWNVNLQSLRARGLWKTLQLQLGEQLANPQPHLTALHDIRRLSRVEVKATRNVGRIMSLAQGQAGVKLQVGQVRGPYECRHILRQAILPSTCRCPRSRPRTVCTH